VISKRENLDLEENENENENENELKNIKCRKKN
jgi:hypothetical protein